jgi:hypothetical protein
LTLWFLWKTHPASKSFVVISDIEAAQLDAMRFVNPGTIIAFRSHNNDLDYGRVVRCDTVSRKWLVKLEEQGREVVVDERQIAGLEDVTKRRSLLAYAPAPDAASDVEAFVPNASLGHLILILRWCNQFQSELRCNSNPSTVTSMLSIVNCLAALSSSFLGTEVSIRVENNQGSYPNQFVDGLLARQIFQLFSKDEPELSALSTTTGTSITDSVSLNQILPIEVTTSVFSLLRDFIKASSFERTS